MAASLTSEMIPRVPVIVVLGATGSGKSKLALEIARKYAGEILSADSMQVYKGLDIITNKVTEEEQRLVKHHMIDYIDPLKRFTVVDFRNQSLSIIDKLLSKQQMPVIVGGTNYYIESLLWKVLVEERTTDTNLLMYERDALTTSETGTESNLDNTSSGVDKKDAPITSETKGASNLGNTSSGVDKSDMLSDKSDALTTRSSESVECKGVGDVSVTELGGKVTCGRDDESESVSPRKRARRDVDVDGCSSELHRRLREVDPEMAGRLHPNDRRKIMRSLQVYNHHGRTHSSILQEQRDSEGGSDLGGALRYSHSCILWLQCEQDVLDKRLDDRVEIMLKAGLVQELLDFHRAYNEERLRTKTDPDYTTGIFQSIGFKEFHDYLVLSPEERASERGSQMLKQGVEELKLVTRRYARKQIKWILNRFLRRPDRQLPSVFALNATDPSRWDELVNEPAMKIMDSYVNGTDLGDIKPLPITAALNIEWVSNTCEVCNRVFVGSLQWNIHQKSKKHQKMVNRLKRMNPTTTEEPAVETVSEIEDKGEKVT